MSRFQKTGVTGVRDFFETHPQGVLVDVLPQDQHRRQRIPGSEGACVFETAFLERMGVLAPDHHAPVLLYGAGNSRDSAVAAAKLLDAGWEDVRVFSGGLDAWKAAHLPLDGADPHTETPDYAPQTPLFCDYMLDPAASSIRWTGRNDSMSHWGALGLARGELHFDGVRGAGGVTADMTRLTVEDLHGSPGENMLLAHLASEDFFLTALFPEAGMAITDLTPLMGARDGLPNYHMEALIGIRGHEHPVETEVTVRNLPDNRLSLAGQLDLDRTRWGIIYGSARFFRYLGRHKVDDLISLDARLVFTAH